MIKIFYDENIIKLKYSICVIPQLLIDLFTKNELRYIWYFSLKKCQLHDNPITLLSSYVYAYIRRVNNFDINITILSLSTQTI